VKALVGPGDGALESAAGALLDELGPPPGREIWISSGALDRSRERALARAALFGGWAVLREPGDRVEASTFLWARPTLAAGSVSELEALLDESAASAPRWRRAPWLRRRLRRLRALVATGGDAATLPARLERIGSTARVLSFPGSGW